VAKMLCIGGGRLGSSDAIADINGTLPTVPRAPQKKLGILRAAQFIGAIFKWLSCLLSPAQLDPHFTRRHERCHA
jgi:hypothetical protein